MPSDIFDLFMQLKRSENLYSEEHTIRLFPGKQAKKSFRQNSTFLLPLLRGNTVKAAIILGPPEWWSALCIISGSRKPA